MSASDRNTRVLIVEWWWPWDRFGAGSWNGSVASACRLRPVCSEFPGARIERAGLFGTREGGALSSGDRFLEGSVTAGSSCSGSWLARFGCDPWGSICAGLSWLAFTLGSLIRAYWPLLTVVAVVALAVAALLAMGHRRRRVREIAGEQFWELTPPHQLPAAGAAPLWQLLASVLAQHGRRARVALQMWADPADERVQVGVWVPGGMSHRSVTAAIARAWRGCGLRPRSRPDVPEGAVAAVEVVPADGPWEPLVDHQHRVERAATEFEDEPLRAVLDEMTERALCGEFAALQVVVSPERGAGRLGRAGAAFGRWCQRGLIAGLDALPPNSSAAGGSSPTDVEHDPVKLARQRASEAKRNAGPHLRATVRLTVAGASTRRSARREARHLAGSLSALAVDEHVTACKRLRRAVGKVSAYQHGRSFIASTRELAAIWHLPHQPTRHGLPQPGVERRRPDIDLPRLDEYCQQHRRDRGPGSRRRPRRRGRGDEQGNGGENDAA